MPGLVDIESLVPQTLREVVETGGCCSCGACEGILGEKARMVPGDHRRLRPQLSTTITTEEEARVLAACPGRQVGFPEIQSDGAEGPKPSLHPVVGPWVSVKKGHASDEAIRFRAAAAGGLTALACHLLTSGKVDFILHITPSEPPLKNFAPRLSFDVESVLAGSGSRYAPSAPLASIDSVLAMGKKFALVGKPCDVNALCNLGRVDPRVNELCKYKLSISCGQYADPPAYHHIMDKAGVKLDEVEEFRYRGKGCPGWSPYIRDAKGTEVKVDYIDFWFLPAGFRSVGDARMSTSPRICQHRPVQLHVWVSLAPAERARGFLPMGLTYQWRCKMCPDFLSYEADVTVMDCWPNGQPERQDAITEARRHEQDGWVLVVSRTAAGQALVEEAEGAGAVSLGPAAPEDVLETQPHQVTRAVGLFARRLAHKHAKQPRFELSKGREALMLSAASDADAMAWATRKEAAVGGSASFPEDLQEEFARALGSGLEQTKGGHFHLSNYEGAVKRIHRGDPGEAVPAAAEAAAAAAAGAR